MPRMGSIVQPRLLKSATIQARLPALQTSTTAPSAHSMNAASSAPASASPSAFDIKSANLPLVALLLKSADLQVVQQELQARFGNDPDFFDGDALIIDLTPLNAAARRQGLAADAIDLVGLLPLLRQYKLAPVAVKGGTAEQTQAAVAAGLLAAPDARVVASSPPTPQAPPPPPPEQPQAPAPAPSATPRPAPTPVPVPAAASSAAPVGAMVISKPLRSGQQVYARGRDLVVLAIVNPGAEVIADGHIHVYAPLRGKAMAGARGNTEARIFALSLEAELISIAGIYRTSDNPLPANVLGKPTQISLEAGTDGEKLIFQAL